MKTPVQINLNNIKNPKNGIDIQINNVENLKSSNQINLTALSPTIKIPIEIK